jgi:hypothetical protein
MILTKKKYDRRTHETRIRDLHMAFAEFKAKAYASGKVNDCSANKILKEAKVDRSYIYSKDFTDKTVQEKYRQVAVDIQIWRDDFQDKKGTNDENTALSNAQSEINQLTKERDEAHSQCAGHLKQVQSFKCQIIQLKEQHVNLVTQQTYKAHANNEPTHTPSVIDVNFSKVTVIEPDRHLYKNGKYIFLDKNVVDAARRLAREELVQALSGEAPVTAYILVGPPCSGKSKFAGAPDIQPNGRKSIIIDACNLSQRERFKWVRVIQQNKKDFKICAVFFDTPLSKLFTRNNERNPDKQMSDERIEDKFKSLEMIDVLDEEYIDEIKVVRHGVN